MNILYKFTSVAVLSLVLGSSKADDVRRDRTAYAALSADQKRQFDECEVLEHKIASTKEVAARKPIAAELANKSSILVKDQPSLFRAWIWQGLTAVLLDNEGAGVAAMRNLSALGAAESTNPQVVLIVQQAKAKGWIKDADGPTPKNPESAAVGVLPDEAAITKISNYIQQGDLKSALAEVEELIKKDPNNPKLVALRDEIQTKMNAASNEESGSTKKSGHSSSATRKKH